MGLLVDAPRSCGQMACWHRRQSASSSNWLRRGIQMHNLPAIWNMTGMHKHYCLVTDCHTQETRNVTISLIQQA